MVISTKGIRRRPLLLPSKTVGEEKGLWISEDINFKKKNPVVYRHIARLLNEKRIVREQRIKDISLRLSNAMAASGFTARVQGRPKHLFSIYSKMCQRHLPFEALQDLNGLRVILSDIEACYRALQIIHRLWQPLTGSFDDYIAFPRPSGYRSLHTTVNCDGSIPVEIQIRTDRMHEDAEYGCAAHWLYKRRQASAASRHPVAKA